MENFDFQQLRESFTYYPQTGTLIRNSNGNSMTGMDAYGYIQVGYKKKMYKAHRLIWAIVHGEFPKGQIDHINGIRHDNRIDNLRVVTQHENAQNKKQRNKRNKSGYTGVCWNSNTSKWQAGIHFNGAYKYLGLFDTPESANAAYISAKKLYHPSAPVH